MSARGKLGRSSAEPQTERALSFSTIPKLRSTSAAPATEAPAEDHLVIRPRRGLPGSRSVGGGLLVALAALLAWWAAVGDGGAPTTRYVVAARQIGPGERLTEEHLALTTVELGPDLRRSAFTAADSLLDAVATGPIAPGELIQAGAVAPAAVPTEERELTFPVSATWAVGGELRAGDHIDVYATYGDGTDSLTRRVLAGATVRRIDAVTDDRLGDAGHQTITVGLGRDIAVARVVNAVQSAELTVARVSGEPGTDADAGNDRYDADAELSTDRTGPAASPDATGSTSSTEAAGPTG